MLGAQFYNRYFFDAEAAALWTEEATLQCWLDVEAALAEVQAELGLIPAAAAQQIRAKAQVKNFDLESLAQNIRLAQHPFVPVLKDFEAVCGSEAGGWIHWGATTQNIFDIWHALKMQATVTMAERHLAEVCAKLRSNADRYRATVQAGRTHGQHALPITYGYKLASWLDELERHAGRLAALHGHAFVARTGGGVGSYAAMGGKGRAVEAALAKKLGLSKPAIGGRSDFDRQTEVINALAMLCASCERIANDLLFMQRTEIAEIEENHYAGRVGSSTMAQKRNPTEAQKTVTLCRLVRSRVPLALESMVREEEGDAVSTHAVDYFLPEFSILSVSALASLASLLESVKADPAAMRRNAELTGGLILAEAIMMALAEQVGRGEAHHLLHSASARAKASGRPFAEILRSDPAISKLNGSLDLDAMLAPENYLGEIDAAIDSVLAAAP